MLRGISMIRIRYLLQCPARISLRYEGDGGESGKMEVKRRKTSLFTTNSVVKIHIKSPRPTLSFLTFTHYDLLEKPKCYLKEIISSKAPNVTVRFGSNLELKLNQDLRTGSATAITTEIETARKDK
ncbi:hypothetical protein Glove_15g29 [Diversispora epigaea]|uniref:Uncharacterized protein n=1 Tax=Diversispora epigaea TaxID=1348612 RepID=A0A397JN79_9GLOM|nr:hypothetical protein Glove_15g29 [Diversispora epigaea]